ncbi:MAG: ATP-binding cassette domain-containing protein [Deltaproteobacteria bacterium]|nr:ATP-binding cassette domain-containing protein [Deltaproteobacteria bacterium]
MIDVCRLSKAYSSQVLFADVSFQVNPGEKVGLVGRNGHGKTTMLRMIAGLEQPDQGEIRLPRHCRLGYVTQALDFGAATALDEACLGLRGEARTETWRAEKVLAGLGFERDDLCRHPSAFSGGFQVRLNLAKVLLAEPEVLLLDEPTNYLDVIAIRWLTGFLNAWPGELVLVTHDRSFMDAVVTHVLAIHRCGVRKMRGRTAKVYEQIEKDEAVYEKTRKHELQRRKQLQEYIDRYRAQKRMAASVQSKVKQLERMGHKERLRAHKDLDFVFTHIPTPAKAVLHAVGIRFGFEPDRPLIRDFSLSVGQRDRICVIGKNGKGKTTLLRLLAGELRPLAGEVKLHNKTRIAHFAQAHAADLDEHKNVEQEIMDAGADRNRARAICGLMLFSGDAALKPVSVLSGGERSRLLLGRILASPGNLLLLDEPTNHLDIQSSDAFVQAVEDYPGAAVIVTHNEMFLRELANRFVIFQGGRVELFEGRYDDFLAGVGWEEERERQAAEQAEQAAASAADGALSRKEIRRLRAEFSARSAKVLRPLEERVRQTEGRIMELEARQERVERDLIEASEAGEPGRIGELGRESQRLRNEIDALYDALERAADELKQASVQFEDEREQLDALK